MGIEEKEFINMILLESEPSLEEVENNLSMNENKILQVIHCINSILPYESIEIVNEKLQISEKCADELYALLIGDEKSIANDHHDVEVRKNLVEAELILNENYHSLETLSEQFYVSRNTMYADIKKIKNDLRLIQLSVSYSRKSGYQIKGPEYLLRNHLVQISRKLIKTLYGKSCLLKMNFIDDRELSILKERLACIEEKTQIRLTDEQIEELPFILAVLMTRIRNFPKQWNFKVEKYDIRNTQEFSAIKDCLSDFPYLKEIDILYLSLHILSSNRIESALDFLNSEEIIAAVDQFVDTIKNKLAINFMKETEFKEKLLLHVQPAIFRNILGFRVNNPLAKRFISEHNDIFMTVADAVEPFEQIIGHALSDEEIVYLAMIVLGWLYHSEENRSSYFKGAVLCPNGTSVSLLLLENLKEMFPQIEFIGAFSFRQFEQMDVNLDFIFTTKPIKNEAATIVVPPFLELESRRQLRNTVSKLLKNDSYIQAKSIVFPLQIVINIIMLIFNWTKTLNVDMWNVWSKIFTAVMVSYISNSIIMGFIAAAIQVVLELKVGDIWGPRVQQLTGIPGVTVPHHITLLANILHPFEKVMNKTPGLNKQIDSDYLKDKIGIFGENEVMGAIIGLLLGFAAGYSISKSLTLAVQAAAALVLFPMISKLFSQALSPISEGVSEFMRNKFKDKEVYIGLDWPILAGRSELWVAVIITIPVLLIFSIILPGNAVLPFAGIINLSFVVAALLLTNANIIHMIIMGIITSPLFLYAATFFAPYITRLAKAVGTVSIPHGMMLSWSTFESPDLRFLMAFASKWNIIAIIGLLCWLGLFYWLYKDVDKQNKQAALAEESEAS